MFLSHKDSRSMINKYTLICKNHQTIKTIQKLMTKGNIQCKNINPEGLLNPEKKNIRSPESSLNLVVKA
jgi:hypothetical protein